MRSLPKRCRGLLVVGAVLALAACSSSSKSGSGTTTTESATTTTSAATTTSVAAASTTVPAGPTVATAQTKLGKALVNDKGFTLYTLPGDTATKSTCTGGCATLWPPLVVTGTPTYGAGLAAADFGKVSRGGGVEQLTYKGKPLYTFATETAPASTSGQGVGGFQVALVG